MQRSHRSVAISAAETIRRYWRTHPDAHMYEAVDVEITPSSYEIISNLVDGYPPLKRV